MEKPDLYSYLNYQKYLKDYYTWAKGRFRSFSYQTLATRAGFNTKTFLFKVMKGEKALSQGSVFGVAQALRLNKKETAYFDDLVRFNHASTVSEKGHYFDCLQGSNNRSPAIRIRVDQFEYFSKWYHAAIRELVTYADFKGDFNLLGKSLNPPIKGRQAKASVMLLEKLGLIKRTAGRGFRQKDSVISTGDEVRSLAVQRFQRENMVLASEAIDRHPRVTRDISSLTCGISKKGFERLKSEIQDFRKKLAGIIEADKAADRVYQVNFQLFPLSRLPGKE